MKKIFFKTFGCRTNLYDTQVMISSLKEYQITLNEDEADIIVINSCTVTNDADKSVRNYISSKKGKQILYTGCGFKHNAEKFFKENRIFGAFPHSKKTKIEEFLKRKEPFLELEEEKTFIEDSIIDGFVGKSRAFIKVQEGCDFECSYCIIPIVRGPARSLNEELILKQIKILTENGYSEFILTGTNTGSYGKDTNSSIAKLIKKISNISGIKRIRLSSLEPSQVDDELIELLNEPFMAKHLHIAIQHTSNKMLEIMRRRNRVESDLKLFEKIALKSIALGTDFITGHPGESDQIWNEAFSAIKDFPLTHIHTFTYSKRDSTHSSTLKDTINANIARERSKLLRELIAQKNLAFRQRKMPLSVLIESRNNGYFVGLDQFFNRIFIKSNQDLIGSWIEIVDYEVKSENNFANLGGS